MHGFFLLLLALAPICFVTAKQIVITVGHNVTNDATKVFQPASVVAQTGDVVYFNFTLGNHTATQSTFSSPCIPAHDTNVTVNGFNSGFRDAGNSQAITNLPVIVDNPNATIWFFDYNTCAQGGVGGININDSSSETLQGFQRNAIRLNSSTPSSTASTTATTASHPTKSASDARRTILSSVTMALSLLLAVF